MRIPMHYYHRNGERVDAAADKWQLYLAEYELLFTFSTEKDIRDIRRASHCDSGQFWNTKVLSPYAALGFYPVGTAFLWN